jgi:hypothetical protein
MESQVSTISHASSLKNSFKYCPTVYAYVRQIVPLLLVFQLKVYMYIYIRKRNHQQNVKLWDTAVHV